MKSLVTLTVGALFTGGIALAGPAHAGCQSAWTPWGGGQICDGPLAPDGSFQRCQAVGVLGFGGNLPCFTLNVNNLNGQAPWVGP
nr:hypothetical protein [Mycobacterium sp. IS-1590]